MNSPDERARLEGWLRKLLDLTLRNPLINLRPARGVAVVRPTPLELVSILQQSPDKGVELTSLGWSDLAWETLEAWRDGGAWDLPPSKAALAQPAAPPGELLLRDEASSRGSRVRRVAYADARWDEPLRTLAGGRVLVDCLPDDLQLELADIERQQRVRQQEGGVHTLYLAVGLLRWKESGSASARTIEAPLMLLPVSLERPDSQTPFSLVLRDENPVFNPSLSHKLRQDFGLDFAPSLPEEGVGVDDVAAVLDQARELAAKFEGWSVVDESRLGLFSFHKQHLWNDLSARASDILSHPVVAQIAGHLEDPGKDIPQVEWEGLDEAYSPRDLLTPLPVDASQMRALSIVDQGRNLVIDGPPGTGKSQTITNLIAHALGKGKRVLFVSEKATALAVVHDRLEGLGLGAFCLDLHSAKAQKSEVVAQFRRTMETTVSHDRETWARQADELHQMRLALNQAMRELHEKRPNGYSLFEAIGVWSKLEKPSVILDIDLGALASQDAKSLAAMRAAVVSWSRSHAALPSAAHRFDALSGRPLPDESEMFGAISQSLDAFSEVSAIARSVGLDPSQLTCAKLPVLVQTLDLALDERCQVGWREWLMVPGRAEQVRAYYQAKRDWSSAWAGLGSVFESSALGTVGSWQNDWKASLSAAWPAGWWRRRAIRKMLSAHTKAGSVPTHVQVAQLLVAYPQIQDARASLRGLDQEIERRLTRWAKSRNDWEQVLTACEWADDVEDLLLDDDARKLLVNPPPGMDQALCRRMREAVDRILRARMSWRTWFPAGTEQLPPDEASLDEWTRAWSQWRNVRPVWPAWKTCEQAAKLLREQGLAGLVPAALEHKLSAAEVEKAWSWAYWRTWIAQVQESISRWDLLGLRREEAIADFAALDERVEATTRQEILYRLVSAWKKAENEAPAAEMRVLAREVGKKRAHLPPRQLLARTPSLWPTMKPCILVSPLSAAQHFGPETPLFDLVVFDEASQISVADAVGVMARGKQVVVVGDPKQMPPSRLFDASDTDDDDDSEQDLDSILDECLSGRMARVLLNWHYRSRHEDLIAFSNHRYYNGELITFPSPNGEDPGIVVHDIGGMYERATRRVNRAEAKAIVDKIVDHYAVPGQRQSIGVITFNQPQQRLINRMIDARRASDPAFDAAVANAREELFVKNLETVQGDERDIICFSTTFSADASGNFPMQFGPLGQMGGERRLNVAITRARHRMELFTSFHPGQMDVSSVRHKGLVDLRDYLFFARGGEDALLSVAVPTLGVADSPFEIQVHDALVARGWTLVPQVGCSGYRIDLAVRHPERPGEYLAAIECDGATYHSFKVARDRDRMRQKVLERLGWRVLRIWSTDWWQDEKGQIDRIDRQLRELLDHPR